MFKKTLYPKTKRIDQNRTTVNITEKIDGSNLGFYKQEGEMYIAQRNNVIAYNEIEECKGSLYGGLYGWLKEYGDELQEKLYEGSVVFGEWIGMGRIKYGDTFPVRFLIFAKARIDEDLNVFKLTYRRDLIPYTLGGELPEFVDLVPLAYQLDSVPTIEELDELYSNYCDLVGRTVEGFVVEYEDSILKYVRHKNGKPTEHQYKH